MIHYFEPLNLFDVLNEVANAVSTPSPKREIIDVEYEDITDQVLIKPSKSETETNDPKQLNP